jgi:8-oxo-dGTP pyrophosphatase MutT (NUDIX family)
MVIMSLVQARKLAHDIHVDNVYCGVVLLARDGERVILQQRDDKPGIANPGLITTFGGLSEDAEHPHEGAARELGEELGVDINAEFELEHLCDIVKMESDGSITRAMFWTLDGVKVEDLDVREGQFALEASVEEFRANPLVTPTCLGALEALELRRRHMRGLGDRASSLSELGRVEDRSHAVNEDVAGSIGKLAWVIDGASPLDAEPVLHPVSDARWLAEFADATLKKLAPTTNAPLPVLVREVLQGVREALAAAPQQPDYPPSAAIALIRFAGGVIEYFALSDVSVVLGDETQVWLLDDQVSEDREKHVVRLEAEEGADAVRSSMWHRRQHEMNKRGGYWVFSDDPRAVLHGRHGYVPVTADASVMLCSDGFARLATVFATHSWGDLLSDRGIHGRELVAELRELEEADPGRVHHPRVSDHDDATALWLEPSP